MDVHGRPSAAFPHPSDLRRQVANACDNAEDNGYPIRTALSRDVAEDLVQHVPWLEGCDPAALVGHVEAWQRGEA